LEHSGIVAIGGLVDEKELSGRIWLGKAGVAARPVLRKDRVIVGIRLIDEEAPVLGVSRMKRHPQESLFHSSRFDHIGNVEEWLIGDIAGSIDDPDDSVPLTNEQSRIPEGRGDRQWKLDFRNRNNL
jgi:hypothetical protein